MKRPKRERRPRPKPTNTKVNAVPLFDEALAAEYLCLSPRTLQRWRGEGRGPAYRKVGKRVLYTQRDLEEYVELSRYIPPNQVTP